MNSGYMHSLISLPAIGCQTRHRYNAFRIRFERTLLSSAHKLRYDLRYVDLRRECVIYVVSFSLFFPFLE